LFQTHAFTLIEEIIALTSDYATAKGAYEAVKRRPGRFITLRQKARIIQSSNELTVPAKR